MGEPLVVDVELQLVFVAMVCPTVVAVTPVVFAQLPPERGSAEDLNTISAHYSEAHTSILSSLDSIGIYSRCTMPIPTRRW